jgi:hypothetical protein
MTGMIRNDVAVVGAAPSPDGIIIEYMNNPAVANENAPPTTNAPTAALLNESFDFRVSKSSLHV